MVIVVQYVLYSSREQNAKAGRPGTAESTSISVLYRMYFLVIINTIMRCDK